MYSHKTRIPGNYFNIGLFALPKSYVSLNLPYFTTLMIRFTLTSVDFSHSMQFFHETGN